LDEKLQFDGEKVGSKADLDELLGGLDSELNVKPSGSGARRYGLGSFIIGRGVRYLLLASVIWRGRRANIDDDPVSTFMTSVIMYIVFGIVASIVLLIAMIVLGTAISVDIATRDFGELFILLWQIFLVLAIIIGYLAMLGQQLACAGINLFVGGVWIRGWRGIIWRCFAAPLVGGFFAMGMGWIIVLVMREAPYGTIVSALYVIPAYVITLTAVSFMFLGWISFWRHLRDYLYRYSDNVAFFILFAVFYPFAALAGIPFLTYIVKSLVDFTLYQYSTQILQADNDDDLRDLLSRGAEETIRVIVGRMIAINLIDFMFSLIVTLLIVMTVIIGVWDVMQSAAVIPQILREIMLKKLHVIERYAPETGARINAIKLVIIYGSVFGYFVFGLFVVKYIIPALFGVAIGII